MAKLARTSVLAYAHKCALRIIAYAIYIAYAALHIYVHTHIYTHSHLSEAPFEWVLAERCQEENYATPSVRVWWRARARVHPVSLHNERKTCMTEALFCRMAAT